MQNPSPSNLDDFRRLHSTIKVESQLCFLFYCQFIELKSKDAPIRFWQFVNTKSSNSGIPKSMTYKDT